MPRKTIDWKNVWKELDFWLFNGGFEDESAKRRVIRKIVERELRKMKGGSDAD